MHIKVKAVNKHRDNHTALHTDTKPYLLIIPDTCLIALIPAACTVTDKPLLATQHRTAVSFNCKTTQNRLFQITFYASFPATGKNV